MENSMNLLTFVEARSKELGSLMHEVSSDKFKRRSWFQNLPHHMRRRGASQNPKRVPNNLRTAKQTQAAKPKGKKYKSKPKNLQEEYAKRSTPECTWLENHIWQAKRFRMDSLWGYRLPINSNDRKLGLSHKTAANRAMLQDLSYYCCIELKGCQENILSRLSLLSDDTSGHTFASEMFLDGSKEGYCFLYQPNSHPYKAIGPVTFFWKPVLEDEANECMPKTLGGHFRRLWVWCHPSIYEELVQVLVDIFKMEECIKSESNVEEVTMKDTSEEKADDKVLRTTPDFACKLNFTKTRPYFRKEKAYQGHDVTMVLRKNTLVRHRLIGPLSLPILSQVMKLANVHDSTPDDEGDDTRSVKKIKLDGSDGAQSESVPSSPYWWESYYRSERASSVHAEKDYLLDCFRDPLSSHYVTPRSIIGLTVRDPRLDTKWKREDADVVDGKYFDFLRNGAKDYSQLHEFFVPKYSDSALWEDHIRNEVTATKMSDRKINDERSKCIVEPDFGKRESRIPILLIHQTGLNGFASGWDLIAPMGWSLEFWRALERRGALTAGLRDMHFINMEAGRPSFPCSFPDTEAGKSYEEGLRLRNLKEFYKHPKAKRPNFTSLGVSAPFFMCWRTLVSDWEKAETASLFPELDRLSVSTNSTAEVAENAASPSNGKEYYVLRQAELVGLGNLCRQLSKIPWRQPSEFDNKHLVEAYNNYVSSLTPELKFGRSLILVKARCMNKGRPSIHSGIYLLSDTDMKAIINNTKYNGPSEPIHSTKRRKELKKKCSSKEMGRPEIQTLSGDSSRQMIGYISEGGFSSVCGQGYAVGHCCSIGFLVMMKKCLNAHLRPLVLIKEQHSFQYRVSTIEVIENYL